MDTLQAIHSRRSIRQFTDTPVTDGELTTLLQAAMAAPCAGTAQAWEFVAVTDRAQLDAASTLHGGALMLKGATAGVLVCGVPGREKMPGFWPQDCAAAAQNLLLAAHAGGLGACWVGIYPLDDIVARARAIFGVPEEVVPLAMIAIGHPAESPQMPDRYDPAKVHRDRW